jgi:hypothetical protein
VVAPILFLNVCLFIKNQEKKSGVITQHEKKKKKESSCFLCAYGGKLRQHTWMWSASLGHGSKYAPKWVRIHTNRDKGVSSK